MADYVDAGKVMLTPKGAWSIEVPYEKLDLVSRGTISYVGKKDSIGVDPATDTAEEYWQVFGSSLEADGSTTELVNGKIAVKDYVSKTYVDQAIEEATPEDYDEVKAQVVSNARGINTLSETKADKTEVENKADNLEYNEDTSTLLLKSGSKLLSSVHIEGGGIASVIHIDTHEEEWKANELVTVEIEDDTQTYSGHFDANGDYFHKVSTIGLHTVRVIDTDGQIYSSTVNVEVIGGVYYKFIDKTLPYMEWLVAGGLSKDAFGSLDEILASEVTVRRLMTIHASVDYMIEWIGKDAEVYAKFLASTIALKWIGLRDYAYDHMPSEFIASWLASDNWELALKDHVPTMTSDTAPYGTVIKSTDSSGKNAYMAFDGSDTTVWYPTTSDAYGSCYVGYIGINPTCVKRIRMYCGGGDQERVKTVRLEMTNDGNNWTTIKNITTSTGVFDYDLSENEQYALGYRVVILSGAYDIKSAGIATLQFYGRSLNVSVPTMTSNNAPYGEAIASSYTTSHESYKAFDKNVDTSWFGSGSEAFSTAQIGYDFKKPTIIKNVFCTTEIHSSGNIRFYEFDVFGIDDDSVRHKISTCTFNTKTGTANAKVSEDFKLNNSDAYKAYVITNFKTNISAISVANSLNIFRLDFYGTDYSEREFAEGSTMKYLYDHGLELEPISTVSTIGENTKETNMLLHKNPTTSVKGYLSGFVSTNKIDLASYKLLKVIYGDKLVLEVNRFSIMGITNEIPSASTTWIANKASNLVEDYLDTNSLNDSYYISFTQNTENASALFSITEIWLE